MDNIESNDIKNNYPQTYGKWLSGDNLYHLKNLPNSHVGFIYLDPPFNSNRKYNANFKDDGQEEAFVDTWTLNDNNEEQMRELHVECSAINSRLGKYLEICKEGGIKEGNHYAYLIFMARRLLEMHRVLKPTGSIYLHADPNEIHYLKNIMDIIFGRENFINNIVWKRTGSHGNKKGYGPSHDDILFYSKSKNFYWNPVFIPYTEEAISSFNKDDCDGHGKYKTILLTGAGKANSKDKNGNVRTLPPSGIPWRGFDPSKNGNGRHWTVPENIPDWIKLPDGYKNFTTQEKLDFLDSQNLIVFPKTGGFPTFKLYLNGRRGVAVQDILTHIHRLSSSQREYLGYDTQKPEELLKLFITASCPTGEIVLDPFCGCGTTVTVASKMGLEYIGIDISTSAIDITSRRFDKSGLKQPVMTDARKASTLDAAKRSGDGDDGIAHQKTVCAEIEYIYGPPNGWKSGAGDMSIDGHLILKSPGGKIYYKLVQIKGRNSGSRGDLQKVYGALTSHFDLNGEPVEGSVALILNKSPSSETKMLASNMGIDKYGCPRGEVFNWTTDIYTAKKRPKIPKNFLKI